MTEFRKRPDDCRFGVPKVVGKGSFQEALSRYNAPSPILIPQRPCPLLPHCPLLSLLPSLPSPPLDTSWIGRLARVVMMRFCWRRWRDRLGRSKEKSRSLW